MAFIGPRLPYWVAHAGQGAVDIKDVFQKKTTEHLTKLRQGLVEAAKLLLRRANLLVPVDTGVLKASGFVRLVGSLSEPRVLIGYTANYAIYVHENLDAKHGAAFNTAYAALIAKGRTHVRGAAQQAKFLEAPMRDTITRAEMVELIKKEFAP